GVVVLEDGEGGGFILKLVHQVHGSIHVQQVVVRELLSVKLVEHLAEVSEEITLLMRVLAITQFLAAGIALFESDLAFIEEVEDGSVVMGGGVEGLGGKALPVLKTGGSFAVGDELKELGVVFHGGDTDHVFKILCCSPDQGDPADIDLLDDILLGSSGSHSLLKRIQVHDHDVDLRDLV